MEACCMVSYFASDNPDFDLADAMEAIASAGNCPDAYLTVIADSPDERGFKPAQSVKFT